MDERAGHVNPPRGPGFRPSLLIGVAGAIGAGAKYGALVGAGCGFLWCMFWYPFVLFFTIPVYSLAGAVLGALSAGFVVAVSAAARSVKAGWIAAGVSSLALGLALISGASLAPTTPPPFGPGRPINPAADEDQERTLERNYLLWMAEQDQGERGAFVLLFALPATLCALTSGCCAAWRLGSRHPRWVGEPLGSARAPAR